jgi:hypothetical protein
MKKIMIIVCLALTGIGNAQTGGTVMGKLYNSDSTEVIPFSVVRLEAAGETVSTVTDINGKYKFSAVKPGICNLKAETASYGTREVKGITVTSDGISKVNMFLTNILGEIEVVWTKPKLDIDNTFKIDAQDLVHNINQQSPLDMLANSNSEITKTADNQLIIRGSRAGDVIYYVDGVKMNSMQSIPGIAIGGMTVFTGGVPAKYGDTTGGVVVLETKSYFDLYYAWMAKQ